VLGIVFGVCSVIAMLAIGEGASHEAQEQIKSLGSQNIIMRSVKPPQDEKASQQRGTILLSYGLTYADARALKATIPGVIVIVPGRIIREYVWAISRRVDSELVGTVPWYPEMRNHRVARGRFFSDTEMADRANVCVLGAEAAEKLFPLDVPMGQTVRVTGTYYRVVGVMEPQFKVSEEDLGVDTGAAAPGSRIYVPLETVKSRYGDIQYTRRAGGIELTKVVLNEVTVKVERREEVVHVAEAIKALLGRKHPKADYRMVVPLELLNAPRRPSGCSTSCWGPLPRFLCSWGASAS
jgi:putative ABC transport system permease protein